MPSVVFPAGCAARAGRPRCGAHDAKQIRMLSSISVAAAGCLPVVFPAGCAAHASQPRITDNNAEQVHTLRNISVAAACWSVCHMSCRLCSMCRPTRMWCAQQAGGQETGAQQFCRQQLSAVSRQLCMHSQTYTANTLLLKLSVPVHNSTEVRGLHSRLEARRQVRDG
jgi:hypothetical protein